MSGTTRDVGIKVAVTSDVQGAAQIEAAFARLAPQIEAAMKAAQRAADAAADGLKQVQANAAPAADSLRKVGDNAGAASSKGAGLSSLGGGLKSLAPAAAAGALAIGGITVALGAVKVAAGALDLVMGKLNQFVGLASDLSEAQNKTTVVFGDSARVIEDMASRANVALGQTREQVLNAAGTFGNLLTSMNISQEGAARMSADVVRLGSDLASFNNIPVDDALTALRAGLSGETEPLKRLGINLNDVTLKTKAMELGLIGSMKEGMIPATKAQAAYALILEQSGNAQGDFTRTAAGLANSTRIVQAQMTDMKVSIGEAFRPLKEQVMGALSSVLPRVTEAVSGVSERIKTLLANPAIGQAIERIASLLGDKLVGALNWLKGILDGLSQNGGMDRIKNALLTIGTAALALWQVLQPVGAYLLNNLQPILITLAGVVGGVLIAALATVGPALLALISPAVAAAAPFIALGALIGIIAASVASHWETVGPQLAAVFDNIKAAVSSLVEYWKAIFSGDWAAALEAAKAYITAIFGPEVVATLEGLVATITGWRDSVVALWESVVSGVQAKATALWDGLIGLFDQGVATVLGAAFSLWEGLQSSWESIRVAVSGSVAGLWSWLSEAWNTGAAFVSSVVVSLAENLRAAWVWISTTVSGLVGRLLTWIMTSWGKAGTWLGNLLTKVANVFKTAWSWIRETVGGIVTRLVNALVSAWRWLGEKTADIWERVQDLFSDAWTGIMSIFKSAAGGLIGGLGALFQKMAELAGKGMAAIGGIISRIFTAVVDKIKGLLGALGVDLGSLFTFGGSDDGPGFFERLAGSLASGIQGLMGSVGGIMAWFEAKWTGAKKSLRGLFGERDELKDEAEKDGGAAPEYGAGYTPENLGSMPGAGGEGGGAGPKAYTAPDGMSGRDKDGSEWYIDPSTGQKVYTSGAGKNRQDAKERGAASKAAAAEAKKGAKKGAAGAGDSEDPAVSAARTAAETAAKISEALQAAAASLRELGRTELPGESVWGPKIAQLEVFIQAGLNSFDRLAVGLLDKIGQTEDGAALLDTAKGKAITAVAGLSSSMTDTYSKTATFLQGIVKAKWPGQDQIDQAFGLIGAALSRVQEKSLELADQVGTGTGAEGETSPAAHLAAVGQGVSGWIDAHVKTAALMDVLAKVKPIPAGTLELVQATLSGVSQLMASFLRGPGYDLTTDADKSASDLAVSRDVQETLSGGLDLVTKASGIAELLGRVRSVPPAAWTSVQGIMAAASLVVASLISGTANGQAYDLTRDPERTAIALTVARDQITTMNGALDLIARASANGRQIAKTPAIPPQAWQNVQAILSETSRILSSMLVGPGYDLLRDTERTTRDLGVVGLYAQTLGTGLGLVGQVATLGDQLAKAAEFPEGALTRVQTVLTRVSEILGGLVVGPGYNLLTDSARTTADLAVVSTVVKSLSDALSLVAQAAGVGTILADAKPFDPAAADRAIAGAQAALAAVERYAEAYAKGLQDASVFAEDRLAQVQQYSAVLREALQLIDAAGKFKLGRVLPVDVASVNTAIANAQLTFERLHYWSQVFEAGLRSGGHDVEVVTEAVKVYAAALRDALSLVDAASKLKLDGVLALSATDVNTAVQNAQLTFDRLHYWSQVMADGLRSGGHDVATVMEEVKAYTAALRDTLSLVDSAGKMALADIVLVDPMDVNRAIQNADVALRLVADWARAWHASLEGQKRLSEDVLAEVGAYTKVIKEALDLVNAAVGLAFEDSLPLNEAGVRQGLANADMALRLVEEFSAGWRQRFATLEGELGAAQLRAQAEEIELYTKAAGSALDLIGRAAALVVDAVAPLDPSLVGAALDKARLVLDQVQVAAANWAEAIRAGGRNLADVAEETEAFQKGAAGSFDLLLKVRDFVDRVTAPTILEPLARGAKRIPAPAIEATLAELSRVITLVMTSLGSIYDDPAVAQAIPKAEQLTSKLAPAVDALVKVLDLFSLDRLMKSPLFDLKSRSAGVSSNAAKTRMEQLRRQIVEGVQRTVAALVEALQGIKIPTDLGGDGLDRLAALYEHIAQILERIASLEMPDPSKVEAFIGAAGKLVAGAPGGAGGGGAAEGVAVAAVASSSGLRTLKTENKITVNNQYNQYGDNNFFDEKATKLMLDRLGSFGVRVRTP